MENSKVKSATDSVKTLVALVESLRGEHGCPWDKKQTPRTMLIYLIEEMYELADAIESNRAEEVQEELGDVLFHIIFITRLFQEAGNFSIYDVARDITEKMIRRHPHVFGTVRVDNTDEVRQNWHKIKQDEKKKGSKKSVTDSVPKKLPALMRSYQICERTARSGFDWGDSENLLLKLESELSKLKQTLTHSEKDRISQEFGNLLFSMVNLAHLLKIHPETALSGALKAFEKRFSQMEKKDDRNY
ncbi:MAG: nucleoside triphosphate pyrophosphohydrolase [Desulfobacterales bacterium]|nr:nucleoside triphosphate pyrophosphohydrolase [Desulfobacterales bacterium]NOQ18395.1 nucleoside triphosphate pyrophosphohydrolase [Desulfobacterales bacterium]